MKRIFFLPLGCPITAYRGLTAAPMNRQVVAVPGVLTELAKGKLPTEQKGLRDGYVITP